MQYLPRLAGPTCNIAEAEINILDWLLVVDNLVACRPRLSSSAEIHDTTPSSDAARGPSSTEIGSSDEATREVFVPGHFQPGP